MSLTFIDDIREKVLPRVDNQDDALGKLMNQPFAATTSGSRRILYEVQYEHAMTPEHPDVAVIGTGDEFLFGINSSSYVTADDDLEVLAKINKFSFQDNNYHYYLIVRKLSTNKLDVIERIGFHHNTESYGFRYDNSNLDKLSIGDIVPKDSILKKSTSMDEYGNRMDGVNVNVLYASLYGTTEDGMWVREGAREKFSVPLVRKTTINSNINDIPLNIFGNDQFYKILPDILEDINNGILFSQRREEKDQSLYMQSWRMLRKILMSDEKFVLHGENIKVVDIDIYCNDLDIIYNNKYYSQLAMYADERKRCARELITAVDTIMINNNMTLKDNATYRLQKMYDTSEKIVNNVKHIKDKVYNNLIIDVYTIEHNLLDTGDKVADRFGGKGVVTKIVPDELMPYDENGNKVDVIVDSWTVTNRKNPGQNLEQSCTFTGKLLIEQLSKSEYVPEDAIAMIIQYCDIICPNFANGIRATASTLSSEDLQFFVNSIINDGAIYMSIKSISESITIDTIREIYKTFPWMQQIIINVPIRGSNGKVRFVPARRKVVFSSKYMYRLKQYALEKFSVTSLSATNLKNENTKSKASKNHTALYNNTPVRFGEMESGNFSHVGMEYVVAMLMVHSVSPHARRLVEKMLTDNPYEVDIKPDETAINRGAEILNAYLKTIGLRLKFIKRKKEIRPAITRNAIEMICNPYPMAVTVYDANQKIDVNKIYEYIEQKNNNAITIDAITMTYNQEEDID